MAGWHKDPVRIVRSPSAPPASRFQWPQCSNMAAGVFPAPTVTWAPGPVGPVGPVVPILPLQLAQSNGHDVSELSSSLASLPRPSRLDVAPETRPARSLLPPPSRGCGAVGAAWPLQANGQRLESFKPARSEASSATLAQSQGDPERYLRQIQAVGKVHQQQLEILQRHLALMQKVGAGQAQPSFTREFELLKQRQLQLLKDVEGQLREISEATFAAEVPSPAPSPVPRVRPIHPAPVPSPVRSARHPKPGPSAPPLPSDFRVLVGNATGLLGREVMRVLGGLGQVSPWQGGLQQLQEFRPQAVLLLEAEAALEACEALEDDGGPNGPGGPGPNGPGGPGPNGPGPWVVAVSSAAVFDGLQAPYGVDAEPRPVTQLGLQCLDLEQRVLNLRRSAVLRVPSLYGPVHALGESPITRLLEDLQHGRREFDDGQPWYPTWAGDVASVLRFLLQSLVAGDLRGIYHWQGPDRLTEFQMAKQLAEVASLKLPILPRQPKCLRDRSLDCSRLARSFTMSTPFAEGVKSLRLTPPTPPGSLQWARSEQHV
ncbi:unnamed protein product [Effrenium voratum]|nr:unnamed protein product [Effrenium voratum]